MLRVKLSAGVAPEVLLLLHGGPHQGAPPAALGALLARVGVVAAKPVYELSPDEIADDKYGFAREFSLTLRPGMEPDAAAALLKASDLVEEARPVLIRRSSRD